MPDERRKPKGGIDVGLSLGPTTGRSASSGAELGALRRSITDLDATIKQLTGALKGGSPLGATKRRQPRGSPGLVKKALSAPPKGFHEQFQAAQKRAPKVDLSTATQAVTEIAPPSKAAPPTLPATKPTPPKGFQAMWEKAQSRAPKLNVPSSLTQQPPKLASSGVTLPGPSAGKDESAMEDLTEQVKRLADLMEKQKDKEAKPSHEQWQAAQGRAPKLDVEPPEFRGGRSQASPSRPGRG